MRGAQQSSQQQSDWHTAAAATVSAAKNKSQHQGCITMLPAPRRPSHLPAASSCRSFTLSFRVTPMQGCLVHEPAPTSSRTPTTPCASSCCRAGRLLQLMGVLPDSCRLLLLLGLLPPAWRRPTCSGWRSAAGLPDAAGPSLRGCLPARSYSSNLGAALREGGVVWFCSPLACPFLLGSCGRAWPGCSLHSEKDRLPPAWLALPSLPALLLLLLLLLLVVQAGPPAACPAYRAGSSFTTTCRTPSTSASCSSVHVLPQHHAVPGEHLRILLSLCVPQLGYVAAPHCRTVRPAGVALGAASSELLRAVQVQHQEQPGAGGLASSPRRAWGRADTRVRVLLGRP